jgi:CheY-like chemotaxis protein
MSGTAGGIRVLIADDNGLIADTLSQIFRMNGYLVKTVRSGEQAIEIASRWRPDALVCDVLMDGINGIEAAIRIVRTVPKCLVILFSGQANTVDLLTGAAQRGYHFEVLPKPVHPQVFLDHLGKLENERRENGDSQSLRLVR